MLFLKISLSNVTGVEINCYLSGEIASNSTIPISSLSHKYPFHYTLEWHSVTLSPINSFIAIAVFGYPKNEPS